VVLTQTRWWRRIDAVLVDLPWTQRERIHNVGAEMNAYFGGDVTFWAGMPSRLTALSRLIPWCCAITAAFVIS